MYTVQVLLSTYNGEAYLKEQLDSILNQKNVVVKLFVRDDGSSDSTVDILRAYAALHDNIHYLCGENCGVVASFFRLFELSDPDVDFYALSDQDDVWDEDKLSIACQKLEQMRKAKSPKKKKNDSQIRTFETPLLYCSDAWNTDAALNPLPESMQTVGRDLVPDFRNALIENIARGASIVFNQALMSYIRISMPQDIYMHDWWIYLVASCFGEVYYDSAAHYKYRQHTGNALGAAAPSGSSKLFRRLKQSRTNGGHISRQAKAFERIYHVPEDKQPFLNIITKYQDVKSYRKRGKSGNYLFRQDKKDNRIFQLMFYSNHL